MKKVFAFALSVSIFGAVAAQPKYKSKGDRWSKNNRYEVPKKQDNRWSNTNNTVVYNYNNKSYNGQRMTERERQAEIMRVNKEYDRRVAEYRNDRRLNARDRDYKIQVVEKERTNKLALFGGGLLLGGILGAIIAN